MTMETLDLVDLQVPRAPEGCLVLLERRERADETVNLVLLDLPGLQAREDWPACLVSQDPRATGDFQDWTGPREALEALERRERMGLLDLLVLQVPLDPWGPEEREEGMDLLDHRASGVSMEQWDHLVKLDLSVKQEAWECLVSLEPKETVDHRDQRVAQVFRDPEESRENQDKPVTLE